MSKEFTEMTKKELLEITTKHKIEVESKVDGKPTNAEVIAAIEAHNAVREAEDEVEEKVTPGSSSKKELFEADMTRKERVSIYDTQRFQQLDEEAAGAMYPVSFSNGIIDEAMNIPTDGTPVYVARCLLRVLAGASVSETTQTKETRADIKTKQRARFNVIPLQGLTDEEIEAQRRREMARG